MSRPLLLDTCALIWVANNDPLRDEAEAELQQMAARAGGVAISPISAWEVGQLVARGRLKLSTDPDRWFQGLLDGGMTLAHLSPKVLIASSFLPSGVLSDPADKILAATARALDLRLMTRDRPLLQFAEDGHLKALRC